jgi:HSP20 family protein
MKTALQRETRATGDVTKAERQFIAPDVDIRETRDGYILTAEMPGVNKSTLEVTLEGHELTLVGHRQRQNLEAEVLFRESPFADYRRVFELDPSIDASKIAAHMEQGLLTLHLPKAETVKPRKITVAD